FSANVSGDSSRNPDATENPAKPEATKPEATKPEATTPEITKPEATKPEIPPEVTKPVTPPVSYDPGPRIKPPPKLVALPTRALNPWADEEPGVWYRVRSVRGSQVTQTDTGLKEKGKDFYVLVTQTFANGQPSAVTETRIQVP